MRLKYWLTFMGFFLGACSPISAPAVDKNFSSLLSNLGQAPDLINTVWINTERPLSLAKLRGQVVVLDMWTFG